MENESLSLWVERYRQQLEILNHSPRTWPTTRGVLERFGRFLDEIKLADVGALTADMVREYQRWLFYQPTWTGRGRCTTGQNRCLRVVRGFCRFLHEEGVLIRDPARD